ncbi:MAG: DNA gyrase subunit A, partial [Symbiobacteriaceae bacterium]|nr:DNA gyrase subunit A [Symbiobacteriaceae bacterium]
FTDHGKAFTCKVHELPEAGRQAKGTNLINLLQLSGDEKVSAVMAVKGKQTAPPRELGDAFFEEESRQSEYLFFCTRTGIVKKTALEYFTNVRSGGLIALQLRDDDELIAVRLIKPGDEIVIATHEGKVIRFAEDDVRSMGRTASGVIGVRLDEGDEVISMEVAGDEADLLVITENGYGKRTSLEEYRGQSRGGKGILLMRKSERTGNIAGIRVVRQGDDVMLITTNGIIIRVPVDTIRRLGRVSQGVTIMRLEEGDRVISVAKVASAAPALELSGEDESE